MRLSLWCTFAAHRLASQTHSVVIFVLLNDILGTTTTTDPSTNATTTTNNPLTSLTVTTNSSNGTTIVDFANGTITYTPTGLFWGSDWFNYTITDSIGSSTATVLVTVTPVYPICPPAYATVACGNTTLINVLANITFATGVFVGPLMVSVGPLYGTASVTPSNEISYTASNVSSSSVEMTYRVMRL